MQEPTFIRTGSALSGLLLVLFLVVHLAGLLPALIAPVQFEQYATVLHHQPWLPLLEISLAATAAVHLSLTIAKTLRNRGAGNTATLRSRRGRPLEALASRSKVAAGVITLGFLLSCTCSNCAGHTRPMGLNGWCCSRCCTNRSAWWFMSPAAWPSAFICSMERKQRTATWVCSLRPMAPASVGEAASWHRESEEAFC